MPLPPETIEIGKCYLASTVHGQAIRRVVEILPEGLVHFDVRRGPVRAGHPWPRRVMSSLAAFALQAEREVSCDWTPEGEG